jgi:hypothetical protein
MGSESAGPTATGGPTSSARDGSAPPARRAGAAAAATAATCPPPEPLEFLEGVLERLKALDTNGFFLWPVDDKLVPG